MESVLRFEYEETIAGPVERVFAVLRDRLPDLVPYLPAVDHIELLERTEESPGCTVLVHYWEGNSKLLPVIARPFVTKAMTSWTDYARWIEDGRTCEWRFEPKKFKNLFTCGGVDYLEAMGNGSTRLRLTGELVVYAERVPGVSRAMARRLGPRIEEFVVKKIKPNLMQVPLALHAFFEEERKRTRKGQ